MKKTYSLMQRLMALVLSIVLVVACMPAITLPVKAATGADNTIVDPQTLDQWQNYFGVMASNANDVQLTTEYAGGIWTDKSVFDPESIPSQLTDAKYEGSSFTITDKGDNFLVALSAMASNKQIKGYSTIPTDTVFVLDLSSSMRYTDNNSQSAVDELVSATNKAITDLLALNKNNRVAVIVYAGNVNKTFNDGQGATTIVLPLDTYTTDKTEDQVGIYLQIDPLTVRQRVNGSWQDVPNTNPYGLAVYDGVSSATGKSNSFQTNAFEVATGTFMQDGVYEAMKLLLAADPVVQDGIQAGTDRMPIMVVMTDGEPTMGNPDYNGNDERTDLGTSTMYNYSGSTNGIGHRDTIAFVTSLTMAFAKKTLASHYGEAPLMYTLAYGSTVLNRDEARSVLNPVQASTIQNNLWNSFLNGEEVQVYSNNITVKNSSVASERLEASDRLYVDKYFPANTDEAMSEAFQSIVNEIILQSKYHPTYIETDPNHDGYLTFVDKIGEYMDVTEIKGIIIGDRLFSGAALAAQFNAGDLGSVDSPTSLGDNFVWSVKQRLGIEDTAVAQALLASAYNNKQIYYNSASDFDHYIGWYAKASGTSFEFLDAWYEGATAPADATHIVKSYGFMGDTTVVPGVANTDMMYMTVRVSTEIATGNTIVTWKIPAALVPTLTYEVDVQVDDDGNITDIVGLDTEMNTAESPIRLVYEVELREDIYDWNLTEKVDENYTTYKDPGYVFYSNMWNSNPDDFTRNTYSHFEPSVENERYYYTQDTQVLSDAQGTVYTGTQPSGTGYYHSMQVFEKLTDGSLRSHIHYEPISAEALTAAVSDGEGGWVIPKGTIHRYYDYEITEKVTGAGLENTDTMDYSDHPFVEKEGDLYYTYSTQGNNGKLTLTPATGIKLTKSLADGYANTGDFTFKIEGAIANAQVVRLTAEGLEASRTPLASDGTVSLKAGETVYVIGLTAGNYTVSEQIPTDATYKVANVKVNGQSITEKEAAVTLTAQTVVPVEFTNGQKTYGNLIVSKDVTHPFANVPAALTAQQFAITVDLDGENVANATFAATGLAGTTSVTTDAEGKFTLQLRHGESLTVLSLPEGTAYTVTETDLPAGYEMVAANSVLSGTIDADAPAQAHVVNNYDPDPAETTLTITGTKTVTSQSVPFDWTNKSFQFKLESYDPATDVYTQVGELAEVTADGGSYTFTGLTFDTIGTYYYKVSEVIPAGADRLAHMSYDATSGRVVVHVTDHDVDGVLEIDVQDFTTGNSIPASGNVITFTKNFVNNYTEDYDPTAVEFTVDKNILDTHNIGIHPAGFLFGLYKLGETQPAYTMRTTGTDGLATFHIPITEPIAGDTYILKEIHPADADKIPGMTYDTAEYTVLITATATGSQLNPTVTITDADGQPVTQPVFENEINLDSDSVQFEVKKEMNGDPVTAETFNFTLTETDGSFTTPKAGGVTDSVAITGAGSDLFDQITYTAVGTHYYVVKETAGTRKGMTYDASEYHITVDVVVNGSALDAAITIHKLGAGEVTDIVFTNTYTVSGNTSVTISGTKTLTGRPLLNGEFTFLLTQVADLSGTAMNNPYTQTVHNGPANNGVAPIIFKPITYTAPGTYYYKVSEVQGASDNGVKYDGNSFIVIVTVEDNNEGGLKSSWSVDNASTFNFTNTYKPAPVKTALHGTKDLTGRVLKNGEFTFELYTTDSTFSTTGLTATQTKNNDVHGVLTFDTLEYTEEGTHYYVVREKTGASGNGVTYDTSEYHVTISVIDDHKGNLETFTSIDKVLADGTSFAVSSMVFYNVYQAADTEVVFTVKKTMEGLRTDPSGFLFGLYKDLNEDPIQTVTSDEDGVVSFQPVSYTMEHLQAGSFTYYIKEIAPSGATNGITYDDKVYTVVVELEDDTNGNLVASYTVDGAEVDETAYQFAFVNRYQVTGTAKTDIVGKKTLQGKTLAADMFTFELYAGAEATGTPIATVKNAADGTILFKDVELTALGINTFTVKEVAPAGGKENGITYSNLVYTVTVETEDNGLGGMSAKTPVYSLGTVAQTQMEFINSYAVEGSAAATIEGKKILQGGKKLTANLFTFELYEAGGTKPVAVVQNSADGTFKFDVSFDAVGIYTYTVKELAPAGNQAEGVTYSDLVYTVQITVEDNGMGGLTAKAPVYQLEGKAVENVEFVNVYTPDNLPVSLEIQKIMKTLSGEEQSPEGYSFKIADESGKELAVVKSDAKGNASYGLTFTPADVGKTYTYEVSEVNTKVTGVTYSTAKYTVKIAIAQNDAGQLVSTITMDGKAVDAVAMTFVNTYEVAETPETGDSFNLVLCVGLMVASTVGMATVVLLKKKEEAAQ